jgi:hypothetical protein
MTTTEPDIASLLLCPQDLAEDLARSLAAWKAIELTLEPMLDHAEQTMRARDAHNEEVRSKLRALDLPFDVYDDITEAFPKLTCGEELWAVLSYLSTRFCEVLREFPPQWVIEDRPESGIAGVDKVEVRFDDQGRCLGLTQKGVEQMRQHELGKLRTEATEVAARIEQLSREGGDDA